MSDPFQLGPTIIGAAWDGECSLCYGPFYEGEDICRDPDDDGWCHWECYE